LILASIPSIALSQVTPQNVLTKINKNTLAIKLISEHMGITPRSCNHFHALKVSPREVYFQALRFKFKIDSLYNEIIEEPIPAPRIQKYLRPKIEPITVLRIVTNTELTLLKILKHLNIKYSAKDTKAPNNTSPTDVYNKLLIENDIVNQLLDNKTLPKDVFQVSTLSLYYAGEILSSMNVRPYALQLKTEYKNKTPEDVLNLQLNILSKITAISQNLQIKTLFLKRDTCSEKIEPNDVEELAYIALSELFSIANKLKISVSEIRSYSPGKKYPSDVFQRNTLLLKELELIIKKTSGQLDHER
jgi:hypothetical protein